MKNLSTKIKFFTIWWRMVGVGAIGIAMTMPGTAVAGTMASYRAIYDVRLADAGKNKNLAGITGRIVYNFQKVCGGWVLQQESAMELQLLDGDTVPDYTSFSSWEADDGTRYRFSLSRNGDDSLTILGEANIGPTGGTASFQKPEQTNIKLPAGVLFPVAHTKEMILRAERGETQFNATTFEGTEVEGAKLISSFISKLSPGTDGGKKTNETIISKPADRPGWMVHIAYFDPNQPTPEPIYEIEVDLLDNGVARRWLMGYGSYGAEMILKQIESIPDHDC